MRSCPFLVMMQVMCRLFHVSLAVPCTNVTIQHGLKYAAWMEQDKTKLSCVSIKIYKTFQFFFFKGCYQALKTTHMLPVKRVL